MMEVRKNRRKGFFGAILSLSDRGRASQDLGEAGEAIARAILARHGVREVERVHTPWKVLWGRDEHGRRSVKDAFPVEKVSGDFIGIIGTSGIKVLVECKATDGDRIEFSRLEDHQVMALNRNHEHGAVSMLFLLIQGRAFLLRWPHPGFKHGTSLILKPDGILYLNGLTEPEP